MAAAPRSPQRSPQGSYAKAGEDCVAVFKQFDANGDGVISREELSRVFVAIDPDHWDERRLQQLMNAADTNRDGQIHYEEFVKWLMMDTADWEMDRAAAQLNRRPSVNKDTLVVDSRQTVKAEEPMAVQVDRSEGDTLGINVDSSEGRTLLISSIKADGLFARWNSSSRHEQVKVGDRIVDVNGMRGDSRRIMRELKKQLVLDIVVMPRESATHYANKIADTFDVDPTWLDKGTFSCIRRAVNRETKAVYALKSLHKQNTADEQLEIMAGILRDTYHPNILRLYEVYEDCLDFHLITEFCAGGELFERILQDSFFTERQAASVMAQILAGVGYLHSKSICHRDLQPQHVLLVDHRSLLTCVVKLIDFRSARHFKQDGCFRTRVGQVIYMPPEMAQEQPYGHSCDIWSCGVMLYLALSGYPPFMGETDQETLRLVQRADLVFPESDWRNVSEAAKDLARGLLSYRPGERPSAVQASSHRWIKSSVLEMQPFALHRCQSMLHSYCRQSKFKKAALQAIAHRLRHDEIRQLYDMFAMLDKNGDKLVTFYELKEGLDKLGHVESTQSLKALMEEVDIDGSRQIDYTEFLAAMLERKRYRERDACWAAFQVFDRDKNGRISRQELAQVFCTEELQAVMEAAAVERALEECDADHNGSIDFEEFMAMMQHERLGSAKQEL